MKVWITKYAITKGIRVAEVKDCGGGMVSSLEVDDRWQPYFHKPNWHESLFEAKNRAEEMRLKKIAALKRQVARLEAMRFDDVTK